MRSITVIFMLIFFASCAKTKKEEVLEAIDVAQTYLSNEECDKAIDLLEDVGRQNNDPIYLQVLASAYACKANFKTVTFIESDVTSISTSSTGLMRSLSILTLSDETEADSDEYDSLKTALGILLESDGGTAPSQVNREAVYGVRKAGDMGIETLILSIVQLGKFTNYYGNVGANGAKGGAGTGSTCYINYTYAPAIAAVSSGNTGSCTNGTSGHADLSFSDAPTARRRLCEGLMLFTNILDILDNMDLSGNDTFGDLEDVSASVSTYRTAIDAAGLSYLIDNTSQATCEEDTSTAQGQNDLELVYALLFEAGHI